MASTISSALKERVIKALPQSVRDRMLRVLAPAARQQFDELAHHYSKAPNMEIGFRKLKARGFNPASVADIGAFEGDWTRMAHHLWPNAKKHIFEANTQKEAILQKVSDEVGASLNIALMGPEDGREVTFFVMESGSSILAENSQRTRETETRLMARLDTLLAGQPVEFLKLDVQGFELEVLAGATETLKSAQAVLLEVSLIAINKGAPLMSDVVAFMKERGFEVLDILEIHHRPLDKATNQVDLLFVPGSSEFLQDTRHW